MKEPFKRKLDARGGWARVSLAGADELAFLGASYLMTEDAYAVLEKNGPNWSVSLRPKGRIAIKKLAEAFQLEYENQRLRWALAEGGRKLRGKTLRQALALADAPAVSLPARQEGLSADAQAQIALLVAEAQAAPKDPLGIARPWEELPKSRP